MAEVLQPIDQELPAVEIPEGVEIPQEIEAKVEEVEQARDAFAKAVEGLMTEINKAEEAAPQAAEVPAEMAA